MAVTVNVSLSETSTSVANNTSTVKVVIKNSWTYSSWDNDAKLSLTVDGSSKLSNKTVAAGGGGSASGTATLYSNSYTITHNSDGSKTVSAKATLATDTKSGTVTDSASLKLTTLARKSTFKSVPNSIEIGKSYSISWNKQSSSFTSTLTIACNGKTTTLVSKGSGSSFSGTLSTNLLKSSEWNFMGSTTSRTATVTLTTYSGSTSLGSVTDTITITRPALSGYTFVSLGKEGNNTSHTYQYGIRLNVDKGADAIYNCAYGYQLDLYMGSSYVDPEGTTGASIITLAYPPNPFPTESYDSDPYIYFSDYGSPGAILGGPVIFAPKLLEIFREYPECYQVKQTLTYKIGEPGVAYIDDASKKFTTKTGSYSVTTTYETFIADNYSAQRSAVNSGWGVYKHTTYNTSIDYSTQVTGNEYAFSGKHSLELKFSIDTYNYTDIVSTSAVIKIGSTSINAVVVDKGATSYGNGHYRYYYGGYIPIVNQSVSGDAAEGI